MKKNILTLGLLALCTTVGAQVVSHVGNDGIFYVGENALVYNGGGMQTKGTGKYEIRGNMMVVGASSDEIKTLDTSGNVKEDGGNIVLKLNNPADYTKSTYGQLYIQGLAQDKLTGIVDKEYRENKHGTYQQIALPFYEKPMSTLNVELGKTFSNTRYSKDEILTWNNATVTSDNFSVDGKNGRGTAYYMLGSKNLDTASKVYTLKGRPVANGLTEQLVNAGNGIDFGANGKNLNQYRETYSSYLQDMWEYTANTQDPWRVGNFGKNIYQFGNPYLTNLDLKFIATNEAGALSDGNILKMLWGIRYEPGSVESNGGTLATGAKMVTFTNDQGVALGDVGLIIKPMQTFVLKFRDNIQTGADRTLSFDGLRRFAQTSREVGAANGVTAARSAAVGTVKQLGVIGLDKEGNEIGRTYYVVRPNAITGNTASANAQVLTAGSSLIGTYEEEPTVGGADSNFSNSYWLYINEANEQDFVGKPILMELYENKIKSLKFEIRENAELVEEGSTLLSSGIGFYLKGANGALQQIAHNAVLPAFEDSYHLFYGTPETVLAAEDPVKVSRTKVAFNQFQDSFFVRFDPLWKKAEVKVYDMSGKLVVSQKDLNTNNDYPIQLQKTNSAYIVTASSEKGEKISAKIIR